MRRCCPLVSRITSLACSTSSPRRFRAASASASSRWRPAKASAIGNSESSRLAARSWVSRRGPVGCIPCTSPATPPAEKPAEMPRTSRIPTDMPTIPPRSAPTNSGGKSRKSSDTRSWLKTTSPRSVLTTSQRMTSPRSRMSPRIDPPSIRSCALSGANVAMPSAWERNQPRWMRSTSRPCVRCASMAITTLRHSGPRSTPNAANRKIERG
jgi:hypothetical protein